MNISIQGEIVAYHSDYSATSKLWKVHLRDAFRMVTLGSTECFVKRFASKPRAWDFMVASKGKKQTGLPTVYDAVSTTEDGESVYYLFLEKIEGDTLHDLMKDKAGGKPSVSLMAKALTTGFRTFHSQGYWHADFCAKNIMVATGGRRFVVIDLDSLELITNRPTPTPNELGYIPDQELAMYALTYVQLYIEPKTKSFSSIPGPALNHLQLVFLLDKLTYFSCVLKAEGAKFRQLAAFKDLPQLIHRYLGGYTDQLVKRILDRTADSEMVITQPVFFEKELPKPQASATLLYFRASSHSVLPGQSTQLTWEVVGATKVHLTHLGAQPAKGSFTVQHSGALVGEQTYTLTANGDTVKQTIKIEFVKVQFSSVSTTRSNIITPSVTSSATIRPTTATINSFTASNYSVKEGEYTIIAWDVSGVKHVSINNIGTISAVGYKIFYASAFHGKVEFELTTGTPTGKRSLFVEFPVIAAKPSVIGIPVKPHATASLVLSTYTIPPLPVKSKLGIWTFILGFGLILMLIGFLLSNKNRSASVVSAAPGFIPNQERGLQLFDEFKYDSSFIHLVNFRNDTSQRFATQYNLAVMYDLGRGTTVNDTLAYSLYFECIRSTTPAVASNALYALGTNYLLGKGCARDVIEAKNCFTCAAEKYNNILAINELKKLNNSASANTSLVSATATTNTLAPIISKNKIYKSRERPQNEADDKIEGVSISPSVDSKPDSKVYIKEIIQHRDFTEVKFVCLTDKKTQSYVFLSPPGSLNAMYIQWAGLRFELKKTSGIGSADEQTYAYAGKPMYFSAYFEKIPLSADRIDIFEGSIGSWNFNGVHLAFH